MKIDELQQKVVNWDAENKAGHQLAEAEYSTILAQLQYHSDNEWRQYLPAQHPDYSSNYMARLANWIGNATSEADQKLLLKYALKISFFSHADFIALYRTALNREGYRWVASLIGENLHSGCSAFQNAVHNEIHSHTWFCPMTDSMDINEFYKVNHLQGVGARPGFITLQMLAEESGPQNLLLADNINHYMDYGKTGEIHWHPLKRLVLLEDIVGSGSQVINTLTWAIRNVEKPILFVPLILCPNGAEALSNLETQSHGKLTVRPVVRLERCDVLGDERRNHAGWDISESMENFVRRTNPGFHYELFGYRNTGCSLVTFSNTPDNTLPIVHDKTPCWEPLFPRVYRDG